MNFPINAEASRTPGIRLALLFFAGAFVFSLWAATVGWDNGNLRGVEFRQAQTAISAYFIQQENDFSLAYPTPVLGKPWSIPLEFPLYQWTVVVVSNATGIGLTSAARAVSLLCFYLTLPAVFMLLGQWRLDPSRRWLILSLIVSSPFYIFYSRAFLIETMVLCLSVWFLLGYLRWLQIGKKKWLFVAVIMGAGAGLVKATTFVLYLVPAAAGTIALLWQCRPKGELGGWGGMSRILFRSAAVMVLPLLLTEWWIRFADATKAANPSSQFLLSANMSDYLFGTSETRFDGAMWAGHWRIIAESLVWVPLVIVSGIVLLVWGRRWWGKVFFCMACFGGIQVLMPVLYAWHDYYYVANALFLLVAMGVATTAIFDSRLRLWVGMTVFATLLGGQVYFYARQYYPSQGRWSPEGSHLTDALKQFTYPDDVLLIQGEDWNAMMPYYARRRALMMRAGFDANEAELRRAFTNLRGEKIGALITRGPLSKESPLLKLAVEYFDFNPQPMLMWREHMIYLPRERWDEGYDKFEKTPLHDVNFLPGGRMGDDSIAGQWYEVAKLKRYQLGALKFMQPRPVRFFARFGLSLTGSEQAPQFGAHPETRLRFALAPGSYELRTSIGLSPGAYENIPEIDASDGVEIEIKIFHPEQEGQVVYSRRIDPRGNEADRGDVAVEVAFELGSDCEVELSVTPGPSGLDRRDWAYLGRLFIVPVGGST